MQWAAVVHGLRGGVAPAILLIMPLEHLIATVNTSSRQECLQTANKPADERQLPYRVNYYLWATRKAMHAARRDVPALAAMWCISFRKLPRCAVALQKHRSKARSCSAL